MQVELARRARVAPHRETRVAKRVTIAGLVFLGLGALAGGVALVTRPDGGNMGFGVALLSGSPFSDYLIPGLILGGLFGVGSLVVAILAWRGYSAAPPLAFAIGVGQMIWIVVELAIIKEFSWLHPAMFLIGLVIAAGAAVWDWPAIRAWRGRG